MPEASTTKERGRRVEANKSKNTLNRSINYTEIQSSSMVFLPSSKIKRPQAGESSYDSVPAVTKVEGTSEDSDTKGSIDSVHTVIEKFSERARLSGATSLGSITGIESLVEKKTD